MLVEEGRDQGYLEKSSCRLLTWLFLQGYPATVKSPRKATQQQTAAHQRLTVVPKTIVIMSCQKRIHLLMCPNQWVSFQKSLIDFG